MSIWVFCVQYTVWILYTLVFEFVGGFPLFVNVCVVCVLANHHDQGSHEHHARTVRIFCKVLALFFFSRIVEVGLFCSMKVKPLHHCWLWTYANTLIRIDVHLYTQICVRGVYIAHLLTKMFTHLWESHGTHTRKYRFWTFVQFCNKTRANTQLLQKEPCLLRNFYRAPFQGLFVGSFPGALWKRPTFAGLFRNRDLGIQ